MRGARERTAVAVCCYFLFAATMGQQQLSPDDAQDLTSRKAGRQQKSNRFSELWTPRNVTLAATRADTLDDSPRLELYGSWGAWSACRPRSCTQTRTKRCRPGAHCHGILLKEERPCARPDQLRRRCDKGSRGRRKHRHENQKPPFHVVVNGTGKAVQKIGARSGDLLGGREDDGNGITLKGEYKRAYSKWSRWTLCTKSCTTQRYRWCKRPVVCGKDVIRETAFCYQEGSHCHQLHNNRRTAGVDDNRIHNDRAMSSTHGFSIAPASLKPDQHYGECGLVAAADVAGGRVADTSNMLRIIGGRPTRPGRWPWQVAVLNRFKEAFCGGTLVAAQWVLTAAHCVRKRLYVRLGEYDLSEKDGTEIELRVEYSVTHPQYDVDTVDNDVALLHLPWPVEGPVACLPRARQPLPGRRRPCTIIGWGKRRTTDMFGTDVLHEAQVPIVSNEECRGVYEDYHITGNMFCAGDRRGRTDSCAGDSGGPLLCRDPLGRWTVLGITSFGEGCGKRGKFGIYTRLPNYVRWVHRVMKTYTTV